RPAAGMARRRPCAPQGGGGSLRCRRGGDAVEARAVPEPVRALPADGSAEPVNVRRATEEDEGAVRDLWSEFEREVPEPEGFVPETWEEEWRDTQRQIGEGGVFLAEDDDGVVGLAKIDVPRHGAVHVHLVHVRPRVRRQGVAKALLRECAAQ